MISIPRSAYQAWPMLSSPGRAAAARVDGRAVLEQQQCVEDQLRWRARAPAPAAPARRGSRSRRARTPTSWSQVHRRGLRPPAAGCLACSRAARAPARVASRACLAASRCSWALACLLAELVACCFQPAWPPHRRRDLLARLLATPRPRGSGPWFDAPRPSGATTTCRFRAAERRGRCQPRPVLQHADLVRRAVMKT